MKSNCCVVAQNLNPHPDCAFCWFFVQKTLQKLLRDCGLDFSTALNLKFITQTREKRLVNEQALVVRS